MPPLAASLAGEFPSLSLGGDFFSPLVFFNIEFMHSSFLNFFVSCFFFTNLFCVLWGQIFMQHWRDSIPWGGVVFESWEPEQLASFGPNPPFSGWRQNFSKKWCQKSANYEPQRAVTGCVSEIQDEYDTLPPWGVRHAVMVGHLARRIFPEGSGQFKKFIFLYGWVGRMGMGEHHSEMGHGWVGCLEGG